MKKLSIEYAHIYTNSQIDEEHKLSVDILKEVFTDAELCSLVLMVDDYSFPDPSFDYESFLSWLSEQGRKPDLMIRESQLIPECDFVLNLVEDEKIKSEITEYIKSKKYPCSLFIATWYLIRLGCIESEIFNEELVSEKLINILPKSFQPFEEKALEIISNTKFKDRVADIDYRYFEGRNIS